MSPAQLPPPCHHADLERVVWPEAWTVLMRGLRVQPQEHLEHIMRHLAKTGRARFQTVRHFWRGTYDLCFTVSRDADGFTCAVAQMAERLPAPEPHNLAALAVRHAGDVLLITEANAHDEPGPRVVFVNSAFTQMTGYAPEDILGQTPRILQGPDTSAHTRRYLRERLKRWEPSRVELLNYCKDSTPFWVELDIKPVADETGWFCYWVAVQRDVTTRRNTDKARLHADKMASTAQLAGGIAHDFNNLLMALQARIELASMMADSPESVRELMDEATLALETAQGLTQQLLTFARGGQPKRAPLRLDRLLAEAVRFTMSGSSAAHTLNLGDASLWVEGDSGQLHQVIQNIVLNAREAMGDRGTLSVYAQPIAVTPNTTNSLLPPGDYVQLRFQDDGRGIPKEHLSRLFEPYFTTRAKGTGLGLSVVYSIVNKHGGHIHIDSAEGQGTSVHITLPRIPNPAHKAPAPTMRTLAQTHSGRVLLMDDDHSVAKALSDTLAWLGYEVTRTHDGQEAVNRCARELHHGSVFDLALLDRTVVGGMGGVECAGHLHDLDPALPIVLISGYSDGDDAHTPKPPGVVASIAKPISTKQLALTLEAHPRKHNPLHVTSPSSVDV